VTAVTMSASGATIPRLSIRISTTRRSKAIRHAGHQDEAWLKGEFITSVQQRGAAILKARGASSAASAAVAIVDTVSSMARRSMPAIGTAFAFAPTAATASSQD